MVLNYARNLENLAKEGSKGTTQWVAYYFTNLKPWYPAPESAMILSAIPVYKCYHLYQ